MCQNPMRWHARAPSVGRLRLHVQFISRSSEINPLCDVFACDWTRAPGSDVGLDRHKLGVCE